MTPATEYLMRRGCEAVLETPSTLVLQSIHPSVISCRVIEFCYWRATDILVCRRWEIDPRTEEQEVNLNNGIMAGMEAVLKHVDFEVERSQIFKSPEIICDGFCPLPFVESPYPKGRKQPRSAASSEAETLKYYKTTKDFFCNLPHYRARENLIVRALVSALGVRRQGWGLHPSQETCATIKLVMRPEQRNIAPAIAYFHSHLNQLSREVFPEVLFTRPFAKAEVVPIKKKSATIADIEYELGRLAELYRMQSAAPW